MSPEPDKCVYKTQPEKLVYLMRKATNNREGALYRQMLAQTEDRIRHFGIEGDSGKHYEIGDIVVDGQLVGGKADDLKERIAVFRLPTLTEYLKDGLPVELVSPGELKLSQILYLFGPNISKFLRLNFLKGKFDSPFFK